MAGDIDEVSAAIGSLRSDVTNLSKRFDEFERLREERAKKYDQAQSDRDEKNQAFQTAVIQRLDEIDTVRNGAKWLGRGISIGALFAGGVSGGAIIEAVKQAVGFKTGGG